MNRHTEFAVNSFNIVCRQLQGAMRSLLQMQQDLIHVTSDLLSRRASEGVWAASRQVPARFGLKPSRAARADEATDELRDALEAYEIEKGDWSKSR